MLSSGLPGDFLAFLDLDRHCLLREAEHQGAAQQQAVMSVEAMEVAVALALVPVTVAAVVAALGVTAGTAGVAQAEPVLRLPAAAAVVVVAAARHAHLTTKAQVAAVVLVSLVKDHLDRLEVELAVAAVKAVEGDHLVLPVAMPVRMWVPQVVNMVGVAAVKAVAGARARVLKALSASYGAKADSSPRLTQETYNWP